MSNDKEDPKLVGDPNESEIVINGHLAKALLDTGSCVSVISESLANTIKDSEIKETDKLLKIECADGSQLPYLGYIEADITVTDGLPNASQKPCLFLVIPDTEYSSKTPVILGTNILNDYLMDCRDHFGLQYLHTAKLHTPRYLCFRAISLREKEMKKSKNRIAIIRSAERKKVTIRLNETIEIKGYTDKELNHPNSLAITQESKDSGISSDIDITPTMVLFEIRRGEKSL